jgi:hypothetical protein
MRRFLPWLLAATVACTGGATTTTASPTTTSTAAITTTTTSPETTTTTALAGDPPVVISRFGVPGWWEGNHWVWVDPGGEVPVAIGQVYQYVLLDQPLETATVVEVSICEPTGTLLVKLNPPYLETRRGPGSLAVLEAAGWDLRPRPVTVGGTLAADHLQAVEEALAGYGVDASPPPITQVVTADLDGDGDDEYLVVSELVSPDLFARPGDFSAVILRKLVAGRWETFPLELSQAEADSPFLLAHAVAAVADLNGDGVMEIAVDNFYYEGAGTVIYEYIDDTLGPQPVMGAGCGA